MTDRITTTCQHSHTVTLRLNEGEWPHPPRWAHTPPWTHVRMSSGYEIDNASDDGGKTWFMSNAEEPPAIRAELEAALAAAEASCGGCGCTRGCGPRQSGWTLRRKLVTACVQAWAANIAWPRTSWMPPQTREVPI